MAIAARDIQKTFEGPNGQHTALSGVSFSIADGETLALLGPSGAGKSTLLRILAGLERQDAGSILVDDREVGTLPPEQRNVAIVFERDALFPHLTIAENLSFAIRLRNNAADRISQRVRETAERLELTRHLQKKPSALSAGERQRAALARAVLSDPRVLLLDEPLAHLDPSLRARLRRDFTDFARSFPGAVLVATHDHAEALSSGDRVAVLIDGAIAQCDAPQTVYEYPGTVSVAAFLGSPPMNIFEIAGELGGIRPEHIRLNGAGMAGRVLSIERTGPDSLVRLQTERGEMVARVPAAQSPARDASVGVVLPEMHVRRFDKQTGVLKQ